MCQAEDDVMTEIFPEGPKIWTLRLSQSIWQKNIFNIAAAAPTLVILSYWARTKTARQADDGY
jgi:hypothetical protein